MAKTWAARAVSWFFEWFFGIDEAARRELRQEEGFAKVHTESQLPLTELK